MESEIQLFSICRLSIEMPSILLEESAILLVIPCHLCRLSR